MGEFKRFYNIEFLVKITIFLLAFTHFVYYLLFKYIEIETMATIKLAESIIAFLAMIFAFCTNKYYNSIIYFTHASVLISCALCTAVLGQGYGFLVVMMSILSLGYIHNFKNAKYPTIIGALEILFFAFTLMLTWNIPSYDSPYRFHIYVFNLFNITCLIIFYSTFITKISQEEKAELDKEKAELDDKMNYDYLTKTLNRNSMKNILEQYLSYFKQEKITSITIALGDIDDFKKLNNEYGHNFGDIVLKNIATILKDSIANMKNSYVSRWSDEEFLILLVDISPEESEYFINNIRELIAHYTHGDGYNSKKTTITFGLCHAFKIDSINDILYMAEKALLQGKISGKNTVELVIVD